MEHEIKCPKCQTVFKVDEASFANIVKQVRDQEFNRDLAERVHALEREQKSALELQKARQEQDLAAQLSAKEQEITRLQSEIAQIRAESELATERAISAKKAEIGELRLQITQKDAEKRQLKEGYELRLQDMNDAIERLKDMKLKLSTKAVGESLEQFCQDEFNKIRATAFPNSYFEKDNEVSGASASKGDFIFRDPAEGVESISIMFEMKNESDTTKTKHKNEDFLAELDKDRREKNCEYAVLVTMLEAESDYYNQGIVDVSHRYPKMFVIRPQFFIPLISLLRNAAEKSLAVKQELALARSQNIDITNFENDLNDWKASWATNIKNAAKKHSDAIAQIDKAIADLQKVRDALTTSDKHLLAAENKMDKLTIKRLTAKNPTMREKFGHLD